MDFLGENPKGKIISSTPPKLISSKFHTVLATTEKPPVHFLQEDV
jgi:hypothetical protein